MGWLARSAGYVGAIFALVAVTITLKDARAMGRSLEQSIADLFGDMDRSYGRRFFAILPIPVFLILLAILVALDSRTVIEPPGLFAALNTLFLTILPLSVVYFAARGYFQSGLFTMLMLGGGALTLGLGSLFSSWLLGTEGGGPNPSATILNLSFLVSAVFHVFGGASAFLGRHPNKDTRHKELIVAFTYVGIILVMAILTIVTLKGVIPPFFVRGEGPTAVRQVVVGAAAVLFGISGLLLLAV